MALTIPPKGSPGNFSFNVESGLGSFLALGLRLALANFVEADEVTRAGAQRRKSESAVGIGAAEFSAGIRPRYNEREARWERRSSPRDDCATAGPRRVCAPVSVRAPFQQTLRAHRPRTQTDPVPAAKGPRAASSGSFLRGGLD